MTSAPVCFLGTNTAGGPGTVWEMAIIHRDQHGDRRELQAFIHIDLAHAHRSHLDAGQFYARHPLGLWLAGGPAAWPQAALQRMPTPDGGNWPQRGMKAVAGGYLTQTQAAALWCRWTHDMHVVAADTDGGVEAMADAANTAQLAVSYRSTERLPVGAPDLTARDLAVACELAWDTMPKTAA